MTYSVGNFFRYYVAHPQEAPKEEKVKAWALTVLAGICTLTVLPLAVLVISNIRWKNFAEFQFAQDQKIQNVVQPVLGKEGGFEDSLSTKLDAKVGDVNARIKGYDEVMSDHPFTPVLKKKGVKEFDKGVVKTLQDRFSELTNLQKKVKQNKAKADEITKAMARAETAIKAYDDESARYLGAYTGAKAMMM